MASKILNKPKPKVEPPPMKEEANQENGTKEEEVKAEGEQAPPAPTTAEMDVDYYKLVSTNQ